MRIHNTGNRFNPAGADEMIYIYEWLEVPTATAEVATVLSTIPLWHSKIWGAADEAVFNKVQKMLEKF